MKKKKNLIIAVAAVVVVIVILVVYTVAGAIGNSGIKDSASTAESTGENAASTAEETGEDSDNPSSGSSLTITVTDGTITTLKDYPVEEYVTLGEYIGLEISIAAQEEVDEDMVTFYAEYHFSDLAGDYAAELTAGQLVKEGDTANIDFTGYLDGEAFDGGSSTGYDLVIGSGSFIDGFEEGLIGVAVGETVDLELTFPTNYSSNPSLAGEDVVFTVTVNYVTPEMTDENVALVTDGEFSSVEELQDYWRDVLEYYNASSYLSDLDAAVMEALIDVCSVSEVPDYLYNMLYENITASIETEAASYGIDGDTYCSVFVGLTLAEYATLIVDYSAPEFLIAQAIANAEGLNLTEDELDEWAEDYRETYGYETVDDLYENYISREYLEIYIMYTNVENFLAENAVITETEETE